ncbi:MAG: hypothetical protein LUH43_07995 [Clostridia bacterium]|nr:hypothetical protein [Clostridia bacterium]
MKNSVLKSVCFGIVVFMAAILIPFFLAEVVFEQADYLEAFTIATVGAFLGYAAMRNSGKNGKNDDEKDKK